MFSLDIYSHIIGLNYLQTNLECRDIIAHTYVLKDHHNIYQQLSTSKRIFAKSYQRKYQLDKLLSIVLFNFKQMFK